MKIQEPLSREKPQWRATQRSLPLSEKLEVIGQLVRQTRELDRFKPACKPSSKSN